MDIQIFFFWLLILPCELWYCNLVLQAIISQIAFIKQSYQNCCAKKQNNPKSVFDIKKSQQSTIHKYYSLNYF